MNQQQLQIARAALWHQTAAPAPAAGLLTFEDAAHWLEDIGLCLFLPRHTQIPAPAPSLVEACQGAASVTPLPAAIALATEFATRLIDERRAIPLNLLGTFSEQPDFLITTEILPWVAAVRGDRQWKAAPAGRTAPIVVRAWEALDREGEKTAIAIREILGREVTEAAVLRALVELWTTLRAAPAYAAGQPTRWSLLKNRFPAQLATGSNTAQTTALSALLSIYLRSAVAATAEEAEVFLSPLTARSRIREVVHGMMATRQLGTMSVASQTLLFVEGSLPEHAPEPEQPVPQETPSAPRMPFKKEPRPTRWELPAQEARSERDRPRGPWQKKPPAANRFSPSADRRGRGPKPFGGPRPEPGPRPGPRPAFGARPASGPRPAGPRPPSGKRPAFGSRPTSGSRSAYGSRPTSGSRPKSGSRPAFGSRPGSGPRPNRPDAKPWQRPSGAPPRGRDFRKENREWERAAPENRPSLESRPRADQGPSRNERRPPRSDQRPRPENRWRSSDRPRPTSRPGNRPSPGNRPPPANRPPRRDDRAAARGPRTGEDRPASARPFKKFGAKPRFTASGRPGSARTGSARPSSSRPGSSRPSSGSTSFGKPGFAKSRTARPGTGRPGAGRPSTGRPSSGKPGRPGSGQPGRPSRPFRGGGFSSGQSDRPAGRGSRPASPGKPKNKFRKSAPSDPNPRKNRSQEENPE